jgi:L-lactate dehydrogenase complex protein LldE
MTISLFLPCILDQAAPQTAQTVAGLLERLGVAWDYPREQTCCGQFALTVGALAAARRLMRHFFEVFRKAEAIVCPSASCTLMVRRHYPELAESTAERRLALEVAARTLELSEFLDGTGLLTWRPRFPGTLVLHRSCKARQLGVLPAAARLLEQVEGLRLAAVSPYYTCCGFGGVFRLQHPDIATNIGRAYLRAVAATGAAGLVSLDYGCVLHLKPLAAACQLPLTFHHLAEVLLEAAGPA